MMNVLRHYCILCLCLLVVACGKTIPDEYNYGDPVAPLSTEERIQVAARNAAVEAHKGRVIAGALKQSEDIYKKNPRDSRNALVYAHDLRQAGMAEQAQMILRPFVIDPARSEVAIMVEYAKVKLERGDFEGAQAYAQEAMVQDDTNATIYHVLGVAVDAQGHHQAAENHFKKALSLLAEDDPLRHAVYNNLALALLGQGKTAEAESALSLSRPDQALSLQIKAGNAAFVNAL